MEKCKNPFSGNLLKIIAALSMTLDHIGVMLFPKVVLLRILGRLALPIFAFFIAEGCRYTKNRARYLGTLVVMASLFQIVYFLATKDDYLSIFVTFSLSVCLIYLLDACKKSFTDEKSSNLFKIATVTAFLLALVGVYLLNLWARIDYGFWGCVLPLFASLFLGAKGKFAWLERLPCRVSAMAIPLLGLALALPLRVQWYAFFALPLLLLYNGKRGKYKMKYFFYIFYPAHLVILYGIVYFL